MQDLVVLAWTVRFIKQHFAEEDYIVLEAETYTEVIKLPYHDCERVVKLQVFDLAMG